MRLRGAARRCGANARELAALADVVNSAGVRPLATAPRRLVRSVSRYTAVADDTPRSSTTPRHPAESRRALLLGQRDLHGPAGA